MSAAGLRDALERFERHGFTTADVARWTGRDPRVLDAAARGERGVPRRVAALLRWQLALHEQQRVMEESGLPACPVLDALDARFPGSGDMDRFEDWSMERDAHTAACPLCRARQAYAERHAPLPPYPHPPFFRLMGLGDRLPAPLRPPDGAAGRFRWLGLAMASVVSAYALLVLAATLAWAVATGGLDGAKLRESGVLLGLVPGFFLAFYLAGWSLDATRPIARRFWGYVLRGALATSLVYGVILAAYRLAAGGLDPVRLLLVFALFAGVGALGGAGWWARDRITARRRA
ncbi:MAG TPA: hypothetical protein VFQ45_17535 [Longimicrobium sp.]|nr:hypothetical protein [Longimicrobium sp.]